MHLIIDIINYVVMTFNSSSLTFEFNFLLYLQPEKTVFFCEEGFYTLLILSVEQNIAL